jgi:hypothetical protein
MMKVKVVGGCWLISSRMGSDQELLLMSSFEPRNEKWFNSKSGSVSKGAIQLY